MTRRVLRQRALELLESAKAAIYSDDRINKAYQADTIAIELNDAVLMEMCDVFLKMDVPPIKPKNATSRTWRASANMAALEVRI